MNDKAKQNFNFVVV